MLCFPKLISSLPGANPPLPEHKIEVFVRFCQQVSSRWLPRPATNLIWRRSTPVWLAIWRTWAGFANSQLRYATIRNTYSYICTHPPCCTLQPLLRHSKSIGPSAPIAYATYASPPDEAAAWPRCGYPRGDKAAAWPGTQVLDGKCCCCLAWVPFLQITARTNPCSRHLWGTLARSVASICAHRARCSKLIICLLDTYVFEACAVICRKAILRFPNANSPSARVQKGLFCVRKGNFSQVLPPLEHKIGELGFLYSGRVIAERA